MYTNLLSRLKRYCDVIAPSGAEDVLRKMIEAEIKENNLADSLETDHMGNLIAFKKGKKTPKNKVLLSAHMDEIGIMVKYISEEGYLYFDSVGGIDPRVLGGRRVVLGEKKVLGVIASKAIHLQKDEEKGKVSSIQDMFIDIGCSDFTSANALVSVGDVGSFVPNYEEFGDGLIKSKAIDDRAGCAILLELMGRELEYDTWFSFTTCEEVGTDGAKNVSYSVAPDIAIAVESTTAGDIEGTPKSRYACSLRNGAVISHMDGGTIYDKKLVALAKEVSAEKGIKSQLKQIVAGGNEAYSFQRSGKAARVLAISVPTRYIHSASNVAAKEDIAAVAELLYAIIERGFDNA